MSPGQMLSGQMSLWLSEIFLDVPRNLPLKLHQNLVGNNWDIADIEKQKLRYQGRRIFNFSAASLKKSEPLLSASLRWWVVRKPTGLFSSDLAEARLIPSLIKTMKESDDLPHSQWSCCPSWWPTMCHLAPQTKIIINKVKK